MKLAGQEVQFKAVVPMKAAKRGLKLCDLIRDKMLEYLQSESEDGLPELQALWGEFAGIAFESGKAPAFEDLDAHEVLEASVGFTQARSRTSA